MKQSEIERLFYLAKSSADTALFSKFMRAALYEAYEDGYRDAAKDYANKDIY